MRLIAKPSRNSESIPPFLSKLVNNGLPLLLTKFIKSRRQGLSERTINFYEYCLEPFVNNYEFSSEGINQFLTDLTCGNAKHAYYRSLRVFSNWAYREGYIKENPIKKVDSPKCIEVILPSLTHNQVLYLIKEADTLRDKCIISLFADSGMRLSNAMPESDLQAASTCTRHGCFGGDIVQLYLQRFLRGLGYGGLTGSALFGIGSYGGFGVMSGFGELGRGQECIGTTEWWGSFHPIITDLPLPTSNPIDAGVVKFCEICTKCAEACPTAALQFDKEPSWELASDTANPNLKPELFNNPGKKTWNYNQANCQRM